MAIMKNIFKYSPGFLAGVILSSAFAGAAAANSNLITNTIDELWVFVAGDPVLASQVNENFEYLDLKIDDEVGVLSDDVIANTVSILTNAVGVGVNQSAIVSNSSDISSLGSDNTINASNISTNASDISTNASDISTNASDISTNASRITHLESWPLLGSWSCQLYGDLSENFVMDFTNTGGHYTFSPFTVLDAVVHDTRYSAGDDVSLSPITPLWTREESVFFLSSVVEDADGAISFYLYVRGRLDVETNTMSGEYHITVPRPDGPPLLFAVGTYVATKL
jgi:hypothetical protein